MRLLHTSDWHLGQSLHQYDRTFEHERFLEWLIDTLVSESVDVLLIAGDVFDNSNPSAVAQSLLYRFLTEAHRLHRLARQGRNRVGELKPMRLFHYSITYLTIVFLAVAIDPILHLPIG